MKASNALALTAAFVLLAGCATTAPTETTTPTDTSTPTDFTQYNGSLTPKNETPYVSEDLGFQLTLPATWDITTVSKETTWAFGKTQTLYFQNKDGVDIFAITRLTKDQWASIEAEDAPKPREITADDTYVWVYDQSQDATGVEAYVGDVENVIQTFQIIK